MWGCFAGFARKTPPHLPFVTATPNEPISLILAFFLYNIFMRVLFFLLSASLLLAACTPAAPTNVLPPTLTRTLPPPTNTAVPPPPTPTSIRLPPTPAGSPTPLPGFPVRPWTALPADRPLVVYASGGPDDQTLYAADPLEGIAYAYRFPATTRFATPFLAGLSPDARYFVYFEGGQIEDFYGQPRMRTSQPDLVLHVLELASGEVIFSAPLLSPAYPDDLAQIAERIQDDWNFTHSNATFEDVIAATQDLMLERIRNVAWSPDGSLLAYPSQDPGPSTDLYFFSPASSATWPVMDEPDHVLRAVWSPNSSAIVLVTSTFDRMAREDTTYLLDRDAAVLAQFTSQITYFHHWHDAGHAILYRATDAGDAFEPQVISTAGGSTTLLWDGSFGTIAFTPDLSTYLIGSYIPNAPQPPGPGLFLGQAGGSPLLTLSKELGWSVAYWGSEQFTFAASISGAGTAGVTSDGERVPIDPGYFRLSASPDGSYLAGYNKVYPSSLPGTLPGLRIFAGNGQMLEAVDGLDIVCVAWNAASTALAYQAADGIYVWSASGDSKRLVATGLGAVECGIDWVRDTP